MQEHNRSKERISRKQQYYVSDRANNIVNVDFNWLLQLRLANSAALTNQKAATIFLKITMSENLWES